MYLKDIKFSNSITVEHNTLGGGAIGHIVRNRRVEADTAVLEDRWFHYDQVGSVLSESDADGELVATHYQDAFGVRLEGWETALPGGAREGWAHNTKELDGGTGLMYMYQRWYVPEYGGFVSRTSYSPRVEHPYTFAQQNPLNNTDPRGMLDDQAVDQAIAECKEEQPCRGQGEGPATGNNCHSFVCCVMMKLYGPGPHPSGPPRPYPEPNESTGVPLHPKTPGAIVCYAMPGDSVGGECSPEGVCNAANEGLAGGMIHVGVLDSQGRFHECDREHADHDAPKEHRFGGWPRAYY